MENTTRSRTAVLRNFVISVQLCNYFAQLCNKEVPQKISAIFTSMVKVHKRYVYPNIFNSISKF